MTDQITTPAGTSLATELRRVLQLLAKDPAAAQTRIRRGIGVLRARWVFRRCHRGHLVNVLGSVHVVADGTVTLGDRVQFWEGMIPLVLHCAKGAELSIGTLSVFNYGSFLRADRSVRIGERCMFGSMVHIHDHSRERTAPIVIADDVWVAHGAVIEPGVTIGEGSVVAAGSVVTSDVPPFSLAVGNPAKTSPLPAKERHSSKNADP